MGEVKEKSDKEKRIRSLTAIYYSKPEIVDALLKFSKDREVVPRYYEGFGKRPDILQYKSDIMNLVKKGATSFHSSEELWSNPLEIDSEMSRRESDEQRKGWDLLIDIDSPFLDCSKIAARLIIRALENHGIKNYNLKFSGSKGFHIIVGWKAFPKEFLEEESKNMFPEWPRAISEYLMMYIRKDYNMEVGEILDLDSLESRTKIKKEDMAGVDCLQCHRAAVKSNIVFLECNACGLKLQRRDYKKTKRRLKCVNNDCAGILEIVDEREYYYCDYCKDSDNDRLQLNSDKSPEMFEEVKGVKAEKVADLDLVLVAPRHLFRMPYSLHEKTALASVVLEKDELENFNPRDANPMNVIVKDFYPENIEGEARGLLAKAIDWKKGMEKLEEDIIKSKYGVDKFGNSGNPGDSFKSGKNKDGKWVGKQIDLSGTEEKDFPKAIKKLLKGLEEGRKRGLFILITFLRSCGFSAEYINKRVREWNELNEPKLKEGYVRSQIDWHLKQNKQILPPNYNNESFYKDLGLIDFKEKQKFKNPISEVSFIARKNKDNKYG